VDWEAGLRRGERNLKTLQELLCLNRPNFQINPKQSFDDAKLYFGRNQNEKLIGSILTGYMAGYVPRIYLFGNYGTGKTHLLYHLKHYFDNNDDNLKVLPVVVQIEAEGRTRYQALHKRLIDGIGIELLEKTYQDYGYQPGDRDARYRELFSDPNLYQAMQVMQAGPANKTLSWRWLTGERLSPNEMSLLGVRSLLTDTGDFVDVLVTIGELFRRTGSHLLFLIDEMEALHNVSNEDAQRSWHDAFRRLASDDDNQSVGWIAAFYQTVHDQPPQFMLEEDIMTRIGQAGRVELAPLAPVEVKSFLTDLLTAFVDKDCAAATLRDLKLPEDTSLYPFTNKGLEAFIEHSKAAPQNAIPRTILKALTGCGLEAIRRKQRVLDPPLIDEVVPLAFSESR
jgi:hypothetical protein